MRTSDIKLVAINNPEYLSSQSQAALRNLHLIEKNEPTKSNQLSVILESIVRSWIEQKLSTKSERILSYKEYLKHVNKYIFKYRELDVVIGNIEPEILVEIKCSFSTRSRSISKFKRAGKDQLFKSYSIAKQRWPNIKACIIRLSPSFKDDIEQIININHKSSIVKTADEIPQILISAKSVWDFGIDKISHNNKNLFDETITESEQNSSSNNRNNSFTYSTGDFSKNAFAINTSDSV